jgi:lipoprotein-releasing system permease protein
MNFPIYIAKRYLISKKSRNVINIISIISVVGVTIGTMALIVVLSVFNGLEKLVVSLYNSFDAEIRIEVKEGKNFDANTVISDAELKKIKGIRYITHVLEENALVRYNERQSVVTIKGVDDDFAKMTGLDSMMVDGSLILENGEKNFAVIGQGIAGALSLNLNAINKSLQVYVPSKGKHSPNDPDALNQLNIIPSGVFGIQQDFDALYIIVPLRFSRELLESDSALSAIEIGLDKGTNLYKVQQQIQSLAGDKFIVKNRFQQREILYKILKSEKWAIYLILSFILIIATFNIIGSLTMLIIDKKDDITILHYLGADANQIKKIFLYEGLMITLSGALGGLLLGFILCFLQQQFGLVELSGSGNFIVKYYPVQMLLTDFLLVFLTVFLIGWLAAWIPSQQVIRKLLYRHIQEE